LTCFGDRTAAAAAATVASGSRYYVMLASLDHWPRQWITVRQIERHQCFITRPEAHASVCYLSATLWQLLSKPRSELT